MQRAAIDPILRPDLGISIPEMFERLERVHGPEKVRLIEPVGLSVGDGCGTRLCRPFGGSKGAAKSGASTITQQHVKSAGLSVGQRGAGAHGMVMDMLERMGATACRQWGAQRPTNNCKDICGAVYPYQEEVAAATDGHDYETYAKVWYQPVFWVDSSGADITVEDLLYTGDPVFENGTGAGALDVSVLLAPDAYYSFIPGLPAFDNKVPLVHRLSNGHATTAQNYQGMMIGISARS